MDASLISGSSSASVLAAVSSVKDVSVSVTSVRVDPPSLFGVLPLLSRSVLIAVEEEFIEEEDSRISDLTVGSIVSLGTYFIQSFMLHWAAAKKLDLQCY